jgi:hypothetical protein
VNYIAKMWPVFARRRRLRRRHDEIRAARALACSGPGIVVWARAEDAARSPQAIPRLAAHVEALHAKSGRLLATAEGAGCDAAFVKSLARMDRHLAGLLAAVTRPR